MSGNPLAKSLRVLSLKSVLDPDVDYFYRRVFRWYSREFHTPLHLVEDLPIEDILRAYYESRYEDLVTDDDNHRLIEELQELTETEAERREREMKPDLEKIADEDYLAKVMKEEKERKKQTNLNDLKSGGSSQPFPNNFEMPDIKLNFDDPDEPTKDTSWGFMDRPPAKNP